MGIPYYFKFLCKKFPSCIKDFEQFILDKEVSELYFDLNGLIHPSCSVAKKNNKDRNNLEKEIINETIKNILNIIKVVNPNKNIILAVDGVAPFAKITQQRSRRYKSLLMKKKINNIYQELKLDIDDWDTNMISPGTPFMNDLMKELHKNINIFKNKPEVQVSLYDSNIVGEGEQKIMKLIKNNINSGIKVIHGMDADLIMLSLLSNVDNIYLLREENEHNKKKHIVLNIDRLKDAIINEIKEFLSKKNKIYSFNNKRLIIDYVFLCFLVGNDFIPSLLMLKIDKGNINLLLEIYTNCLDKYNKHLIQYDEIISINYDIFTEIINHLNKKEDDYVNIFHYQYSKKQFYDNNSHSLLEKKIRQLDYLPLLTKTENTIKLNMPDWRTRYYNRYLKTDIISEKDIDKIIYQYLTGLEWTLHYYLDDVPSWSWYYNFNCSPSVKDIYRYLIEKKKPHIVFSKDEPLIPRKQLISILPKKSINKILSNEELNKIDYLFPNDYKLDTLYKTFTHECIVYLPPINYNLIKSLDI